jgi:hypothetical protein
MSADTPNRPMLYDPTEHRIRSFVTRAGRLSIAQARALEELGPKFLIEGGTMTVAELAKWLLSQGVSEAKSGSLAAQLGASGLATGSLAKSDMVFDYEGKTIRIIGGTLAQGNARHSEAARSGMVGNGEKRFQVGLYVPTPLRGGIWQGSFGHRSQFPGARNARRQPRVGSAEFAALDGA